MVDYTKQALFQENHVYCEIFARTSEFLFFGGPKHYRENFVMHPLPAFISIPYILHCIKQVQKDLITPYPIIVDIRPEFETMIIKQQKK